MLDPPRASLTKTPGQPTSAISSTTRLRSAAGAAGPQSRSRTTTYRPIGQPRAANSTFMYSLSMPAALASTPAPAYRMYGHFGAALDGAVLAVGAV